MNLISFRDFPKVLSCLDSQFKQLHYNKICFTSEEITTLQAFLYLDSFQ